MEYKIHADIFLRSDCIFVQSALQIRALSMVIRPVHTGIKAEILT